MKKFLMVVVIVLISMVTTGCATWDGIKQDTSHGWNATKSAIHNATE